jgi:hypothetical protein
MKAAPDRRFDCAAQAAAELAQAVSQDEGQLPDWRKSHGGCLSDLDSVALIMLRHFAAILFVYSDSQNRHSAARVFARTRNPGGDAGRQIVL